MDATHMPDGLEAALARVRGQQRTRSAGERRLLRASVGLRQRDLAELLGVRQSTVSRYESGTRSPRGDRAAHYGELLDRLAAEVARTT